MTAEPAEAPQDRSVPDEPLGQGPFDETPPGPQETAAPAGPDPASEQVLEDELTRLTRELGERTADLQRLQAEYLNYKRRVDRDRAAAREQATSAALSALLPVLDDLDRARQHEELTGGFKAVAESLERNIAGLGLERFGTAGDEFDPRVHEALMHDYSPEVRVTTAAAILQPGYRIGDRVLRPARVSVLEPSGEVPAPADPVTDTGTVEAMSPAAGAASGAAAGGTTADGAAADGTAFGGGAAVDGAAAPAGPERG